MVGDWLRLWPHLPVVAGGMVGSAQGWKEAPYVSCPADVNTLAKHHARVASGLGVDIFIAPGVLFDAPGSAPDVMRGEEIQIAGALADHPELGQHATVVLPGTHSKWVQIDNDRITRFASYMTGEVFALLCQHSILGRLITNTKPSDPAAAETAFLQGLQVARAGLPGDLLNQIFATRTLGLTQRLAHDLLQDYLSGLLIGNELASGLTKSGNWCRTQGPLLLIGEAALCQRYARAFDLFDISEVVILDNTAPRGLWRFAHALGLLGKPFHLN